MKCVKCEGQLHRVQVGDVEVDQCDGCAGIWFDARELDRVLSEKSVDALHSLDAPRADLDQRRGRCPRCRSGGDLVRVASLTAPIHIDTCAVCGGQWLDGGELGALRREGFTGSMKRLFGWILDLG